MRRWAVLICIIAFGCDSETEEPSEAPSSVVTETEVANKTPGAPIDGKTAAIKPPEDVTPGKKPPVDSVPDDFFEGPPSLHPEPVRSTTRTRDEAVAAVDVPDLRTRKTGDDWPRFLGPTGDSKSRETGIRTDWGKRPPRLVWRKKTTSGYCAPTISKGRLLHFDRIGDEQTLVCLKSETGEFLWKFTYRTDYKDLFDYNNGPRCCPVVDGDRVYIYGPKGILNCVRITDGEHLWRVDTFADFGVVANFFGVGSTPVIERDLLITQVGGSPPGSPHILTGRVKGKDSGIVAFDKYTGKVKYKITDELASYSSPVLATIDDRRWCFVFARGGLIGFEPASGKVDFRYPWREADPESVNASNPVIVGDLVFISETYGPGSSLLKVSPGKHEVLWKDDEQERARAMQTHWNTAIHHDGYLYACSGRNIPDAELRCIELATGKIMWRQPDQFLSPDRIRSSLLMVDGHFVCLDEDGKLRLLRINHEKYDLVAEMVPFRGRAELGAGAGDSANFIEFPAWAAPVLSHGLLYVRRVDELVCLELIPEMK